MAAKTRCVIKWSLHIQLLQCSGNLEPFFLELIDQYYDNFSRIGPILFGRLISIAHKTMKKISGRNQHRRILREKPSIEFSKLYPNEHLGIDNFCKKFLTVIRQEIFVPWPTNFRRGCQNSIPLVHWIILAFQKRNMFPSSWRIP